MLLLIRRIHLDISTVEETQKMVSVDLQLYVLRRKFCFLWDRIDLLIANLSNMMCEM